MLRFLRRPKRRLEFMAAAACCGFLVGRYLAPSSPWLLVLTLAAFALSAGVLLRWVRWGIRKLIWRLRNRLLVAYLFIAVVPLVLVSGLVAIGAWILAGQIAVYVVLSELERQAGTLLEVAEGLALTPARSLPDRLRWIGPYLRERYPGLELAVFRSEGMWRHPPHSSLDRPPPGWADHAGLLNKDGALYLWAHVKRAVAEVVVLVPMDAEARARLASRLGEVSILPVSSGGATSSGRLRGVSRSEGYRSEERESRLPPAPNRLDREVDYAAPVPVGHWERPHQEQNHILFVRTRWSAVLRLVFGQTVEWREGVTSAYLASVLFLAVAGAFLVVELASLVIGVNLTRTITRAVHELYTGTQRVMQGDFSHRIQVRGSDQLAELGRSFNRMSENLARLLEIAKEKERLQSELEIAREVQNQLYPRALPEVTGLRLRALCKPARMVSGDYYDYIALPDARLAMAIGDVAGKGISAALLTATVQSMIRAQIRMAVEQARAGGDGSSSRSFSTAELVARLNQHLYAYTPPEKFATICVGIYDAATGVLTYTNAGHPPPLVVRDGGVLRLEIHGMVVGAFPSGRYEESSIRLEEGDLLVCFTDGVTEPENEYGEMFGEHRLLEVVLRHARSDPGEIVAAIEEAVHEWCGTAELQDDLTLMVARKL